ncbi:MAG: RNA methyltransferase [Flavobacteriales bacterium]|nr:RNA methyltransferase [Flavobacteriales bacterium]
MLQKLSMSELGRMNAEEFKASGKFPIVLILDNIRSGLNVGSIFRSADAFRIAKIYCCGYTPVPPHREVLKSALGATTTVDWEYVQDGAELVQMLRNEGMEVFALEQTTGSIPLGEFVPSTKNTAYVLGNEVHGVAEDILKNCTGSVEITQHGTKHSLNVAVCAGIALFSVSEKLVNRKNL